MSTVIKVENLSKKYMISHEDKERYVTLRDILTNSTKNIGSRIIHTFTKGKPNPRTEEFWALKNVSFEVKKGERIGIIGRNGAGKSTLLKLLSRITEPTEGRMHIKGRISSLLEVGTGFHPELTGRENIYLNGAILGMSKTEIKNKFDEIVAFSEVEKFLDTPVKRYSSGMQVRLAFAVAAHLEPEILLVDEVLAVGDFEFQKKCLGKMNEVASEGRTVLFVSHNMAAIETLCQRVILLKNGLIIKDETDAKEVVRCYLAADKAINTSAWKNDDISDLDNNDVFVPISLSILDSTGEVVNNPIYSDDTIFIEISFYLKEMPLNLAVGYCLYDQDYNYIYHTYQNDSKDNINLHTGKNIIHSVLPRNTLNNGRYYVQLICGIYNDRPILNKENSEVKVSFEVSGNNLRSSISYNTRKSTLAPVIAWHVKE